MTPRTSVRHLAALGLKLDELLEGPTREGWQNRYQAYTQAGVPELLARMVAVYHPPVHLAADHRSRRRDRA